MNPWVKYAVSTIGLAAGIGLAAACGGDEDRPPVAGDIDRGGTQNGGGSGGTSGSGGSGTGGATAGNGGSGGVVVNCGENPCVGEGRVCIDGACQCKEGYLREPTPDGEDFACVVDRSCVKLRFLEDHCRVERGGVPQVGLFFAVDYCAGTAVLPDEIDLATSFEVREDDKALSAESDFRVFKRDVESFVMIVLDVSSSILDDSDLLEQVTSELRDFVASLESKPGAPPVTVGLIGFARTVEIIVPFTQDRTKVLSALQAIQDDPTAALTPIFAERINDDVVSQAFTGTSLMRAVEKGIRETERMQLFRKVVSNNGVLTSGTVVTVTDGDDTNEEAVPAVVQNTLVNVISVGISAAIEGETLSAIGRDGAFLAPTPDSREEAFSAVSRRVDEHPDRAYLMVYCSASNANTHDVSISLVDKDNRSTATCSFNGELLGNLACDASAFASQCEGMDCGGFFACGACADDQCCNGNTGTCSSPAPNASNCDQQDHVCEPSDDVCNEVPGSDPKTYVCGPPPKALGEQCSSDRECPVGAFCDPVGRICSDDVISTGYLCENAQDQALSARQCEGLNCQRRNTSQDFRCVDGRARMFEPCSGSLANAECEVGTHCKGSVCTVQGPVGFFECNAPVECASGRCDPGPKLCAGSGYCHYTWADKLE